MIIKYNTGFLTELKQLCVICNQVCLVLVSIARVQVSDGGTYTCVASNRAGVDNRHYSLQVYGETADPVIFKCPIFGDVYQHPCVLL